MCEDVFGDQKYIQVFYGNVKLPFTSVTITLASPNNPQTLYNFKD